MTDVDVVTVFGDGPNGGNPAPIVLKADGLTDNQMQAVARSSGQESAFVVDPAGSVRVSQPAGHSEAIDDQAGVGELLRALGLTTADLADQPVRATCRTKTLVPVRDVAVLDGIRPDLDRVEAVCTRLDSTGLYPYAASGDRQVDARQFPRPSDYPEDPATGNAAAALAFGLLTEGLVDADERPVVVRQGRAMGRPSRAASGRTPAVAGQGCGARPRDRCAAAAVPKNLGP